MWTASKVKFPRIISDLVSDKSKAWGFFDGACQSTPRVCGAGRILFLFDTLYVSFKVALGNGSNNWAKFHSLMLLLRLALELSMSHFQTFGDWKLVVDCMNSSALIQNITLYLPHDQAKVFESRFKLQSNIFFSCLQGTKCYSRLPH